jgi:uncharacterized protein (DUF1684 family)
MAKQPEKQMSDLDTFRADKDRFFATRRESPLSPEQKRKFKGLSYFPDNPELALEVEVRPFDEQTEVSMQTSTGSVATFKRYGRFHFQVEGQDAELTVFQDDHGFFLPFADSLAGTETYGAGRYLEPGRLPDGKFQVDFNLAYNPYCAYNDYYSCPITPAENRIKVPIRAGEKLPEGEWVEHAG